MGSAPDYVSIEVLLSESGEDGADEGAVGRLALAGSDASRVLDRICRVDPGYFAEQTSGTFYFDVEADQTRALPIPPFMEITAIKTDEDGDRTFGTTWSSTDYYLYPLDGPPWTEIQVDRVNGDHTFPVGQRRVEITGRQGTTDAVPEPIRRAAGILALRYFKRPNAPLGMDTTTERAANLRESDPDVWNILEQGGYVDYWGVV